VPLQGGLAHRRVLRDQGENAMVRHEAAEALGSIADKECISLLQEHCKDPEPIVADSCTVALDMLEHELSNDFQYAADCRSTAVTCS
jgi:deoxyhypusine monooxygenase